MLGTIIILSIVCVLLVSIVTGQDNKNAKLKAENGLLIGRLGSANDQLKAANSRLEPLTLRVIAQAIKDHGFEVHIEDSDIGFKVGRNYYIVSTEELPLIFIIHELNVDPDKWDLSLMRQAAHMMSDELVMAKALIYPGDEEMKPYIRFFLAARDGNVASFSDNLMEYLRILDISEELLLKKYWGLVEERKKEAKELESLLPEGRTASKVMS